MLEANSEIEHWTRRTGKRHDDAVKQRSCRPWSKHRFPLLKELSLAENIGPQRRITVHVKKSLLKQTDQAFSGNDEMSLKAFLSDLSQEEASWRFNDTTWTIEEILYHVASCKIEYCRQGFGKWQSDYGKPLGRIDRMMELLDRAQEHLLECLRECSEQDLTKPIATAFHGESAAHFFSIMLMHDISHGAQIGMIRRAYGSRTDFYPI